VDAIIQKKEVTIKDLKERLVRIQERITWLQQCELETRREIRDLRKARNINVLNERRVLYERTK
jgi:hypothetical protein